jgi:hypothetical protein
MAEFQIKKGLKANLFDDNKNLLITPEEGCWYITTDTFELYSYFDGVFSPIGVVGDFEARISALEERAESMIQTYGYKTALPPKGEKNVVYYVTDENANYFWNENLQAYVCGGRDYKEIKIINGGRA